MANPSLHHSAIRYGCLRTRVRRKSEHLGEEINMTPNRYSANTRTNTVIFQRRGISPSPTDLADWRFAFRRREIKR